MKPLNLSVYCIAGRYWLLTLILLCIGWKPAAAQSGSMHNPIVIPVYSCEGWGGTFTDYQNTMYGPFSDDYGNPSPEVWYTFTVSASSNVTISLCGSSFDTYLHVLDEMGSTVASADDGDCGGNTSTISQTFEPGTYNIVAEGYGSSSGDLSMSFTSYGSTTTEGADLYFPVHLPYFDGYGSAVHSMSNVDPCLGNNIGQISNDIYYRFNLSGTSEVTISHCGSGFDTYMHLLDTYGNVIMTNDDNSGTACPGTEAYIKTTLSAGDYYVVSEGYSDYTGIIVTNINVVPAVLPGALPVISYTAPPLLSVGSPIVPLSPTNTGGAVSSGGQTTTTFAGSGGIGFSNGSALSATFSNPLNAAVDAAGNVFVADAGNHSIRKITPTGIVSTFAGSGFSGYADGAGTSAQFRHPSFIAIDASGTMFVSDQQNHRIRKISPSGVVSTFAGSGSIGFANGTGTSATFQYPMGLAFDASGNLYVADAYNHRIRKITPFGEVSNFAGSGFIGSANGPAFSASFNRPMGLAFDAAGNLYVADRDNAMIRKITPGGVVSTLAGSLPRGYVDGPGVTAKFDPTNNLVVDTDGNIYVADQAGNMIRKVTPSGEVSTLAGTTTAGYVDGTGSVVRFNSPYGIARGGDGAMYVIENAVNRIRKITSLKAFTISPALPPGLVFNETDGTISGTPTMASPATTYTVTAYNNSGSSTTTLSIAVIAGCVTPSVNQNYVVTYTSREPGLTTSSAVVGAACNPDNVQTSVQYFDGLGRPMQTIQVKGSGLANKDVVTPKAYDQFGRETKKYLPYASNSNDGSYKADGLSKVIDYYAAQPLGQAVAFSTPFSETKFEVSPLNRTLEQGAPGTAWQIAANNSGHTFKAEYGTNLSGDVKLWTVTSSGATAGTYEANKLNKITIKDENWEISNGKAGTTDEYQDFQGKIILKRVWETDTKGLSTYYVYDDLDNLRYVLPPAVNEHTDRLSEGAINSFTEADDVFKQFIYGYHYDGKKRNVEKKIPGKDWESIVYNVFDQIILSQDWALRREGKWLFNKYDAFGNVIITGLYTDANIRSSVQATVDALTANNPDYQWWEVKASSGIGYSNNVFPQNITYYHSINYYDDYDFLGNIGQPDPALGQVTSARTKGLLTGSSITVLGTGNMLTTVNYYDAEGRVIQSASQHYKNNSVDVNNYDQVTNVYSFTSELKESSRRHINNGTEVLYVYNKYAYDHMGRKISTEQKTGSNSGTGNPLVKLASNTYNDIGQLIVKDQGSTNGEAFLQSTQYAYNERGWLKTSNSDLFNMELKYQENGTQYNGNISQQVYTNSLSNTFSYSYDKLNRLQVSSAGNSLGEAISYDVMGNIKTLIRDGYGTNDYHISLYAGNQLKQISGFINGTYTYNENGNLEIDGPNGNTISYNYLNLPTQVSGNQSVTYTYDATGRKLRKQSSATGVTDYIDGIHYKPNGDIDFVQTEEGIARNNGGNYSYEYNQIDHLGNVRLSFYKNPITGSLEVLQRDDYYAFGLRKIVGTSGLNKYLYNGKELQEELGQLDYGARFYDPVIARWNVLDPLAEFDRNTNPYAYAFNNPLRFIDPDGMMSTPFTDYVNENGKKITSTNDGINRTVVVKDSQRAKFDLTLQQMKEEGTTHDVRTNTMISNMITSENYSSSPSSESARQVDPSTVGKNLGGSTYAGGNNPRDFANRETYRYVPTVPFDPPAIGHDRRFDNLGARGFIGLLTDTRTIGADWLFVKQELDVAFRNDISNSDKAKAYFIGTGLGGISLPKTIHKLNTPLGLTAIMMWFQVSNKGVTNMPSK